MEKKDKEFEKLTKLLDYFYTHVWGVLPSDKSHPINILKQIEREYGRSKAFSGLKQATNDIVKTVQDWDTEELEALDNILKKLGAVTILDLKKQGNYKYQNIMKREKIKNDDEYYYIKEIFDDTNSKITDNERKKLNKLIIEFEDGSS